MDITLRKLNPNDEYDIYLMLQQLPANENGFRNPVAEKTYEDYKEWLMTTWKNSQMTTIIDGWKVPQTTYWLCENGAPVGIGRIRHFLTEKLLVEGGNISYAIIPSARGRGLGKKLLSHLLNECEKMGMEKVLLTIDKENIASRKVALANGGNMEKETDESVYYWITISA